MGLPAGQSPAATTARRSGASSAASRSHPASPSACHGRSASRLRLHVSQERVTVEVYDDSQLPPLVRPFTADGERGRGLAIVRCLAQRLDVSTVTGGGKRVRAVLALSS